MKSTYRTLTAVCVGVALMIAGIIYFGSRSPMATFSNIAMWAAIITSMVGVYIVLRGILIIIVDIYLPSIKLFGGIVAQCITLMFVGILIGLLAPLWSVIIWFVGSVFGFLTNAFEGA